MTRRNLNPREVLEGLRSHGAEKVSFEVVATTNREAQLTASDWAEFNSHLIDLVSLDFHSLREMPSIMREMIGRIIERRRLFYGCAAGLSEVTVAPDGSLYECQRLCKSPISHISAGCGPRALNSGFLANVDDRPVCKECWVRYLCGGGCVHQAATGYAPGGEDDPGLREPKPSIAGELRAETVGSCSPLRGFCVMKRNLAEACVSQISRRKRGRDEGYSAALVASS